MTTRATGKYCIYAHIIFLCFSCTLARSLPDAANSEDSTNRNLSPSWRLIGPGDADQVTSISIGTDNNIYVGTDIGGLYRSVNSGKYWNPVNNGLNNHDITTPVLQDPTDSKILYVGTRGGFYKSKDNALSWVNIREGLPPVSKYSLSGSVGTIALNPFDTSTLLIGMGYRPSSEGNVTIKRLKWLKNIFISNNKGESWKTVQVFKQPQRVNHIVYSHDIKGEIYIATNKGIYKSKDNGVIWKKIYHEKVLNLITLAHKPGWLIAASADRGVIRTRDGGVTWKKINTGLSFSFHTSGRNRYSYLAESYNSPGELYVTNSTWGRSGGLYKSVNYGDTWQLISVDMPESWLKTSRRMNAVAINPIDNTVYLGSSRYIYKSIDRGSTWRQLISKKYKNGWTHTGINVFGHTRTVKVAPNDTNILYIGTADHGMVRSINAGESWSQIGGDLKYADNVWDIVTCKKNPDSVYIVSSNIRGKTCVSISNDKGNTWVSHCNGLSKTNRDEKIYVAQNSCTKIYLTGSHGLMMSENSGVSWKNIFFHKGISVKSLSFNIQNEANIFMATSSGIYSTENYGKNWKKLNGLKNTYVSSVYVSKKNPDIILAGTSISKNEPGRIYRSINSGVTWHVVLDGIQKYVSAIVQMYYDSEVFYAATNDYNYHDISSGSGVYRSSDHGKSWLSANKGLPTLKAFDVTGGETSPGYIYLSLQGSGAYIAREAAKK